MVSGFNRYIVECKYSYYYVLSTVGIGFNRYIVECKYNSDIKADTGTDMI